MKLALTLAGRMWRKRRTAGRPIIAKPAASRGWSKSWSRSFGKR